MSAQTPSPVGLFMRSVCCHCLRIYKLNMTVWRWHTSYTDHGIWVFSTVVMLFLSSVPTNGMIVEIWLKKKMCRNFHLFVCSNLFLLSLCLVLKQLTLCPKRQGWLTQFILKVLSISVDWCSYFSSSWKSTFPGERIFNQPLLWIGKGGFLAWLQDERNRTSASSHLLLTVPWPEKWTSLWFLPSQVGERICFWTRREFYRLGYPSIFFNISKENLEFYTWLCKTLS